MKIRIALSSAENCEAYDVSEGQEIELDVEDYLKGVVAAEMGDGSLEALKAQAVASRTLAARYEGKTITDQSSKHQAFEEVLRSHDPGKFGRLRPPLLFLCMKTVTISLPRE